MTTMTKWFFPNGKASLMTKTIPLALLYQDWPQADKTAWNALFATGDIFDGTGPCVDWSDGSRKKRRQIYGYWLSWMTRLQPIRMRRIPECHQSTQKVSALIRIGSLVRMHVRRRNEHKDQMILGDPLFDCQKERNTKEDTSIGSLRRPNPACLI